MARSANKLLSALLEFVGPLCVSRGVKYSLPRRGRLYFIPLIFTAEKLLPGGVSFLTPSGA